MGLTVELHLYGRCRVAQGYKKLVTGRDRDQGRDCIDNMGNMIIQSAIMFSGGREE